VAVAAMRAGTCWMLGLCAVAPCLALGTTAGARSRPVLRGVRAPSGALRLRGGTGPSGIWDHCNLTKAEGPHTLHEMKAQPFNELLIQVHRCNDDDGLQLAVSRQTTPEEQVVMEGVLSAPPGAPTDSREVSVELERDPTCSGGVTWRAVAKLPPGLLTYKYLIKRGSETVESESVSRKAEFFSKPQPNSVMVATDLDGTMLGDVKKTDVFFRVWNDEYKTNQSALVYNTGRPLDSALGLIERGELQKPAALICSEGTQIFWFGGEDSARTEGEDGGQARISVIPDEEWRYNLNSSWDWPRLKDAVNDTLAPHRANVTKFIPLADTDAQQPMIVIAITNQEAAAAALADLRALPSELRDTFDVIQSSSAHERYILMVPAGAGKGSAALHVAARLGFATSQMLVAGDGENDLPLFEITKAGARGVIVNNACARLKEWKRDEAPSTVVVANASNAGGVLEGLHTHFHDLGYHHRAAEDTWREIIEEKKTRLVGMIKKVVRSTTRPLIPSGSGRLDRPLTLRDYLVVRGLEFVVSSLFNFCRAKT